MHVYIWSDPKLFCVPDDRTQDEDVSECSYHRHNPVEDEEAGLNLGNKDEGLVCVARLKGAVLRAGVVHHGLAGVNSLNHSICCV